jgi:hypothetical protein
MSKGNRRAELAFAGVAAALLALVVAWAAVSYSEQERQQRNDRNESAQHEANARPEQWEATCIEVSRSRPTTCVIQPPNAQAETERSERDLRAQEQMANWALLMFFATTAGVITTMIGLIYVVRAYRLNADATDHARIAAEAAQRGQRAWLSLGPLNKSLVSASVRKWRPRPLPRTGIDNMLRCEFEVVMENVGREPAQNIDLWFSHIPDDYVEGRPLVDFIWKGHENTTAGDKTTQRLGRTIFPGKQDRMAIAANYPLYDANAAAVVLQYVVMIRYDTGIIDGPRFTAKAISIHLTLGKDVSGEPSVRESSVNEIEVGSIAN